VPQEEEDDRPLAVDPKPPLEIELDPLEEKLFIPCGEDADETAWSLGIETPWLLSRCEAEALMPLLPKEVRPEANDPTCDAMKYGPKKKAPPEPDPRLQCIAE